MVVDAAGFGLGEGVVGFGDLDEFFGGGLIATVEMKRVSLAIHQERGLFVYDEQLEDSDTRGGELTGSYRDGISC